MSPTPPRLDTSASQPSPRFDIVARFAKIARIRPFPDSVSRNARALRHVRASSWRNAVFGSRSPAVAVRASKRADREIAQPQIGEAPLLPHAEQRPVQRHPHRIVAFLDDNPDPFAKIAVVEVGSAAKRTAIFRIRPVEPEGERDRIPEQKIDLAAP